MACLDSCCSLIVFSSSSCDGSGGVAHILCFAFVDSPGRPLDNRSFTVVRDILSVKVRMCVCLWWNQSFYLFLFAYFSNEYELMWLRSLGVKFGLKQRGNTVSCGGFMKVSEMWFWLGNGWEFWRRENDEMYVSCCVVWCICVSVSTVFCSRFCSVKRWFGFICFLFLHQQIYFIVFLSFTFKI